MIWQQPPWCLFRNSLSYIGDITKFWKLLSEVTPAPYHILEAAEQKNYIEERNSSPSWNSENVIAKAIKYMKLLIPGVSTVWHSSMTLFRLWIVHKSPCYATRYVEETGWICMLVAQSLLLEWIIAWTWLILFNRWCLLYSSLQWLRL